LTLNDAKIDKEVRKLLKHMTLHEKIGQMVYIDMRDRKSGLDTLIRNGRAGTVANLTGAKAVNEVQRIAVEESRLGIPLLNGNDVIHGYSTTFPIPLAESCSWDLDLIERTSKIAARESAAAGTRWIYSPMLDIARDPRWGRIYEGAGEDTYLASAIGRARIIGLKGNNSNPSERVISCVKHFAGYGACEGGRDYNTIDMSEITLRQVYLPPFKACIDAGTESVMTAFNELNGIPSTANRHLLKDILRNEWKFDGIIVNDYFALLELLVHGVADSPEQACRLSMDAGVDMDMNSGIYLNYLAGLVEKGTISEEEIDQAAYRVLYYKYWLGLFDNPYTDSDREKDVLLCEKHVSVAREAAQKSIVLLKNKNSLLPLCREIKSVAVIGPLADDRNTPLGWWNCKGESISTVSVLDGIKSKLSPDTKIHYSKGCDVTGGTDEEIIRAVEAAKKAEVAVMVVGENASMSGESNSRASLDLPGRQEELIRAVYASGTSVVVVLIGGRPLSAEWISNNIPAVLEGWLLGNQSGNAVADVLFGDCSPSGKLTVTVPRSSNQVPVYYNHKNTGRPADSNHLSCLDVIISDSDVDGSIKEYAEMVKADLYTVSTQNISNFSSRYKDVPVTHLYPFGFGLSYTEFAYSDMKLNSRSIHADEKLTVRVKIKNVGKRAGDEIVQLYIRDMVGSVSRPVRELKGFRRISLLPGEEKEVVFELGNEELGFYNSNIEFVTEPGRFKVYVGPDSVRTLEDYFDVVD
jgi:beta-glucosidase